MAHRARSALISILLLLGAVASDGAAAAEAAADAHAYRSGDYEFTVAPPPAWVDVRSVAPEWSASGSGANGGRWRYWLLDSQVDRRHGARSRYFDRAYEAVSPELVQEAGKQQIWFNPDHQHLTIHRVELRRDGKWLNRLAPASITLARRESEFERDMSNGLVSALVVLDDIRAGDVIRFAYTIDGVNPVLDGLVDEEFAFGATDPILDRHARALFDDNARIDEHRDRGAPESSQRHVHGMLEWSAEQRGLAAIVDESAYPVWYDAVPEIVVGEHRSWAEIAAWAQHLYPAPQPLPADLEQRVGEWRALPSAELRVSAALRAVQEDVRYFGTELGQSSHRPAEPADTWSRRYGDCKDKARLLATLLGRLGIDAHPALVSAGRGKAIAELPPAASLFDHVIVAARVDGATWWLDGTQTQQRGSPGLRLPGEFGFALPVAAGTRELARVGAPESALDRTQIVERLQPVAGTTNVRLQVETEYNGVAADRTRRRLKAEGADTFERNFLDFYRKRYGDVDAESALAVSDDEERNRLRISERYVLKNPWIGGGSGQKAVEIYADAIAGILAMPKTAQRQAPLAVDFPLEIEQRSELELPEGWRWLADAQQHKLEDAAVTFEFDYSQANHLVSVTQRLKTRRDVVEPEDYARHFALLRDANELFGRRLVVGVPSRDAENERSKRLQNLMRNILDDKHANKDDSGH